MRGEPLGGISGDEAGNSGTGRRPHHEQVDLKIVDCFQDCLLRRTIDDVHLHAALQRSVIGLGELLMQLAGGLRPLLREAEQQQ